MIEWDKKGEQFVLESRWDLIEPISFTLTQEAGLRIKAYPSVKEAVCDFEALFADDPFSDAALEYLWGRLALYMEKWGYREDRFRDRYGYILTCDKDSVRTDRILPSTRRLCGEDDRINQTTYRLRDSEKNGCVMYGTEQDGAILSVAVSHTGVTAVSTAIEFGVETAPVARQRGYAVSNLAAAVSSLDRGVTAFYRCHRYNLASLYTAESAGFGIIGQYYRYLGRKKNGI
ncbi:MAG: hypothetical protein IJW71_06140 [Clostridia bacterium]|nr:hypothetical protein [Clostridia bacterium]